MIIKFVRLIVVALTAVSLVSCGTSENQIMKIHQSRPEILLFMPEAADQMQEYFEKHESYATEWYMLGFTFANEPYRVEDPDVRPTKEDGNRWKPRACEYTYVIEKADATGFLIHAINADGKVEFQIDNKLEEPKKVKPKD